MKPEFKAEMINGRLVVKAVPERKPNGDLVMHVPSMALIEKLIKKEKHK